MSFSAVTQANSLSELLSKGRQCGADFVEFFLEKRDTVHFLAEQGRMSVVQPSVTVGASVRLFKGQQDILVSTNDVSVHGLNQILKQALQGLDLSIPGPAAHPYGYQVQLEPLRDTVNQKQKDKWRKKPQDIDAVVGVLMNYQQALKKHTKHLHSTSSNAFYDVQEIWVAASDGVFARDLRLNQTVASEVVCTEDDHRCSCRKRSGDSANPGFFDALDVEALSDSLATSAGHMLHAQYAQQGTMPVVLANDFGGVIFHEACGHLLETTAICRQSTPFLDKKNQVIAHSQLTAIDDGLWHQGFGSIDIDDEGMAAQRTVLIENGVLKNFLCDRHGALVTGLPRTGSGRRQNYSYAPASRMRNTYICPGVHTPQDLITSVDKGLYCKNLGGGSVGSTGEFNFVVEEAWEIEKGKLTKPVKGAMLIGHATDILKKISMSANDLGIAAGFCGSVSGSVYVTVGQPHIKVDGITVGGR